MEPLVPVTDLLFSATARVIESAFSTLGHPAAWPDPASGFAFRLLRAAEMSPPTAFSEPLRDAGANVLRRAPDLAAFGYLITEADDDTQIEWAKGFERLSGREVFPPDRNSFIHNPLELLGVAIGARECKYITDAQRAWLSGAIQRGFAERLFLDMTTQAAAAAGEWLADHGSAPSQPAVQPFVVDALATADLVMLAAISILVAERSVIDVRVAEDELVRRALTSGILAGDAADAAGVYVLLTRAIDRAAIGSPMHDDPVARIAALAKRFQLFVDRLQARQRDRPAFSVDDEYDVQDLLHAILKLHFDDVRPEEWSPSYAGNSSRIDFYLPRERTIIEAKMTRKGLGQREVANELIIDIARYAQMPKVDRLICLVYDPTRRCSNPSALEHDLANTEGRLRVVAVVVPTGT